MIQIHPLQNCLLNSVTYVITDDLSSEAYLIDCGDAEKIIQWLVNRRKILKGIFLTHCHYDHIYGLNDIISHFPDACIYSSISTFEGLDNPKINLSKYHEKEFVCKYMSNVCIINSIYTMTIFQRPFIIYETPGHETGCLSYEIAGYLFTGDSFIPHIPVFTKWRRSVRTLALQNEEKLKQIAEKKGLHICPGHN